MTDESQTTEIAYALCPYLIGLEHGTWDPARPEMYPPPECKRCEPTELGIPGCLFTARLVASAVKSLGKKE